MSFKSYLVFYTLVLFCLGVKAQQVIPTKVIDIENQALKSKWNQKSAPQTSNYDVNFYRLDLDLNPSVRFIQGNVTTYFTVDSTTLNSIVFDFSNQLFADSAIYHGISYTNLNTSGNNTVEFQFPTPLVQNTLDSITIFYRGTPRGNPTGTPFARVNIPGGDLIWTLSEPYGAQDWWPCKNSLTDKADSVELLVTVPQNNRVAANGLLLGIDSINNNVTYHWKTTYPIVTYLVAIGAGNYDFYQSKMAINNDSLLMHNFLYTNQNQNQSESAILPFMLFFDSLFGPYPFIKEKYGHASFSFGGGMEHQTISFMGNYGGELKAHELAHQWFGNKVTCGSWSDLWLNESFATYLTGLTYNFNVVHPSSLWQTWLRGTENGAFFPNGSVYRYGNDTLNVFSLFNNQVYGKGAITLHTLRWKIGDSAFFAGVRNYITDSTLAYGFAKTPDLKQHLEASSGTNLTEFFNDWIYGPGYPNYSTFWSQSGNNLTINIQQTPSNSAVSFFDIPVPYRLVGTNLDTIIVFEPTTNSQTFNLSISQQVDTIVFDPRNDIFARETITTNLSEPNGKENKLIIYPNPGSDLLNFKLAKEVDFNSIQIYDSRGVLVKEIDYDTQINISDLSQGLYFVLLKNNEVRISKTFRKVD